MSAKIYAEYLDHMGSDLTVVNAARASFGKESDWQLVPAPPYGLHDKQLKPEDANLIRFLATGFRASEWEGFLDRIVETVTSMEIVGDVATGRKTLTTMLHEYKRKAQHWAPFAHPQVQIRMTLPIFLARQFVKHCVTGDTEVTFVKWVGGVSNGTRRTAIRDLYAMWTGAANKYQGGAKGRRNVSAGHVRVYNETTKRFESSHISDVIHQGVQPVYRITTESGQTLRATSEHQVMTQRGWAAVSTLSCDDCLVTEDGLGKLVSEPPTVRWNDWADKQARRAVQKDVCAKCGGADDLEADHIVPVSLGGGHESENMQCLCHECHKAKSALEKSMNVRNQYDPRYARIVAVIPDGEEDVYDITVEGTHNFMANGLVVHNCVGGVWSEESRRYISGDPEIWYPDTWHTRPQDIKQGSGGPISKQSEATWNAENAVSTCIDSYKSSLSIGVAPEEARITLPLNMMTTVVWTGSLAFWARVCNQRVDSHAQLPAQELGKIIASIIEPLFPVSWKHLTT